MQVVTNLKELTSYYASESLVSELQEKIKEGDFIVSLAYTDYGGSVLDKVAIAYFTVTYPENIVREITSYSGENAFIFGEPAKEFWEAYERYPLGFEEMEDIFTQMQTDQEIEDFGYFLDEYASNGYTFPESRENSLHRLLEERSGYYSWQTSGIDFSSSELLSFCVSEGILIAPIED